MKQDSLSVSLVKLFIGLVVGLILVMAGFGVGYSAGYSSGVASVAGRSTPVAVIQAAPTAAPTATSGVEGLSAPTPIPSPATPVPTPVKQTPTPTSAPRPTPTTAGASDEDPVDEALIREVWGLLKKQFYGDLPQGKEVTYNAIRGIVERLGDQHTAFVDPKSAAIFNSDIEGSFEGIGAQVELAEGGGVRLRYLFPNQPAEKAGLKAGDIIIAVDGKDITKLSLLEAISLIRGPRDTKVVLTIRRDQGEPFDVTVVRARIEIPVVETKTLADGKIQYIALSEFSSIAPTRLADALNKALATKPTGLILDLRGNPGGLLDAAVRIGSYFVPEGPILIERMKDGSEKVYNRTGRYLLGNTPLVVLVDGGSASASEIVAGAIQDAGSGVLIGEKTFGKGSVQLPNTLSDGSQLRVTIARWFTPKGRGIHGAGLEPDIKVPLTKEDAAAKRDPQLDRAVQYLLEKK
ncbi:MAG: S41 family peptidase [Anaerolineae bacterium]